MRGEDNCASRGAATRHGTCSALSPLAWAAFRAGNETGVRGGGAPALGGAGTLCARISAGLPSCLHRCVAHAEHVTVINREDFLRGISAAHVALPLWTCCVAFSMRETTGSVGLEHPRGWGLPWGRGGAVGQGLSPAARAALCKPRCPRACPGAPWLCTRVGEQRDLDAFRYGAGTGQLHAPLCSSSKITPGSGTPAAAAQQLPLVPELAAACNCSSR